MYTLILDSSNVDLSVGLAKDDKLIDFINYEAWQSQSEYMTNEIDNILSKHNVSKDDLKDIIVTIGPGSYTGLRIALTIAKVMSLALNIPLYTLSSLHPLKCESKPSICLLNARSARSYIGVYEGSKVILKDQILKNDEVKEYIASHPDYVVCGDTAYLGIEGYRSTMVKEMLSLKEIATKYDDSLGVHPLYLKD